MDATGRCLCGAVSFTAREVSPGLHACHCGMCRRWTGGPTFGVMVGSVTFDGAASIARYDSSPWAERGFCSRCGSHLFYRVKETDQYALWLGSFDDQRPFQLESEIYIDDKPAAYDLAGEHPRMTGAEFLASIGQSES